MSIDTISSFVLPLDFGCIILNNKRLLSNVYSIKLGIDPLPDCSDNAGIGLQRIKYINDNCLHGSIIVEKESTSFQELNNLTNNLVVLPCETYDVYIGSILMAKFQAITYEYFEIHYLSIASMIGDHVQFNLLSPHESTVEIEGNHWWNQNNVHTGSKEIITWEELNLAESPKFKPTVIKGGLSEH